VNSRPFEYSMQRPDGTYQIVGEGNPIPVTVRGLPQFHDDVQAAINSAASRRIEAGDWNAAAIVEADRKVMVELWWASWAICGQIEMTRKAMVWAMVGLGALFVVSEVLCRFIH